MDAMRSCQGCRFDHLDGDDHPCSGCIVIAAGPLNFWTPTVQPAATKQDGSLVLSDGGSSTYYFLPKDATELNDLIEFKRMSFARANIFKAIYRMGEKVGTDVIYDINKIELFCQRLRGMVEKGIPL